MTDEIKSLIDSISPHVCPQVVLSADTIQLTWYGQTQQFEALIGPDWIDWGYRRGNQHSWVGQPRNQPFPEVMRLHITAVLREII